MPNRIELVAGEKIVGTRLTVLSAVRSGNKAWVECTCGTKKLVGIGDLRAGRIKSCGCRRSEATTAKNTTHGMSRFPEYGVWQAMIRRCKDSSHAKEHYADRGIFVCNRWINSFEAFYTDMGPRPSPEHSLDRFPDNDGPYEPGNVRWATWSEQMKNTRANKLITFRGQTRPLVEWAEITGLARECIAYRLEKDWPVEEALTLPSGQELRMVTRLGKTMSVASWARELGIDATLVYGRLYRGWSVEDALTKPVCLDRERAEDGRYC